MREKNYKYRQFSRENPWNALLRRSNHLELISIIPVSFNISVLIVYTAIQEGNGPQVRHSVHILVEDDYKGQRKCKAVGGDDVFLSVNWMTSKSMNGYFRDQQRSWMYEDFTNEAQRFTNRILPQCLRCCDLLSSFKTQLNTIPHCFIQLATTPVLTIWIINITFSSFSVSSAPLI